MGDEFADPDFQKMKGRDPEMNKEKDEGEANLDVPTPSLTSVKSQSSDQPTGSGEGTESTSLTSGTQSAEGKKSESAAGASTGKKSGSEGKGAIAERDLQPESREPTPVSCSSKECLVETSPDRQESRTATAASGSKNPSLMSGFKSMLKRISPKKDEYETLISDTDSSSAAGKESSPERTQAIEPPSETFPFHANVTGQEGGFQGGRLRMDPPEGADEPPTEMSILSDSISLSDATDRKGSITSFTGSFVPELSESIEDVSSLEKETEASSSQKDLPQGQKRVNDPEDSPEVCESPRKRVVSREPEDPENKSKDDSDVEEV